MIAKRMVHAVVVAFFAVTGGGCSDGGRILHPAVANPRGEPSRSLLRDGALESPSIAESQGDISVEIDKHARLHSDGGITFTVQIACGPLPGTEDFREALAGAGQEKTGAAGEGGIGPDVVCDGVTREYTGQVFPITDEVFSRGPAGAGVSVFACNVVGDEQVCIHGASESRIVISGRVVP